MTAGQRVRHYSSARLGVTLSSEAAGPFTGDLGPMVKVQFTDGLTCWCSVRQLEVVL